ncbi:TetR family transcriptional regulator [Agromyces mediolanus]|uniref:TetR/AcrR family transcriptional regulator n=1 Tax=Agromyces mediolanus TaxID=41986 RepID=UPI00203A9603|nr:TetR family transcriptional regulator [Agromyces mediolanus]MCM3656222.1 TetR family transcriptional regulator [Agromyces mediolanus]
MAWDTEGTKRRLLDAATVEFAQHGFAGGRIDRIAVAAGVNKERIYQYFGKKDELFDAVLVSALRRVMDEVPLRGEGPAAVADYAGRLFDHHVDDPTVPRLVTWEGLERGRETVARADRLEHHTAKVRAMMGMLPGVDYAAVAELLLTIVTLCDSWPVLPQVDEFLSGRVEGRRAERRAVIVGTVERLARALTAEAARP